MARARCASSSASGVSPVFRNMAARPFSAWTSIGAGPNGASASLAAEKWPSPTVSPARVESKPS